MTAYEFYLDARGAVMFSWATVAALVADGDDMHAFERLDAVGNFIDDGRAVAHLTRRVLAAVAGTGCPVLVKRLL